MASIMKIIINVIGNNQNNGKWPQWKWKREKRESIEAKSVINEGEKKSACVMAWRNNGEGMGSWSIEEAYRILLAMKATYQLMKWNNGVMWKSMKANAVSKIMKINGSEESGFESIESGEIIGGSQLRRNIAKAVIVMSKWLSNNNVVICQYNNGVMKEKPAWRPRNSKKWRKWNAAYQ